MIVQFVEIVKIVNIVSEWLSEWVTRSPIELFWTAKNMKSEVIESSKMSETKQPLLDAKLLPYALIFHQNMSGRGRSGGWIIEWLKLAIFWSGQGYHMNSFGRFIKEIIV